MKERDRQILHAIRDGGGSVISVLYDRTYSKIKGHILRNSGSVDDANDVFQDAMVILFQHVRDGKYKEEYDIDAFMFTICKNLWVKQAVKNKKVQALDGHEIYLSDTSLNVLEVLESDDRKDLLKFLLKSLGKNCQKILSLSIYYRLSMREIAVKLNLANEDVVKATNYRCKQKLIKLVKENPQFLQTLRS